VFETWGYSMNYVLKTKDPLNEWNVILIYYVMDFLKSQKYNYFKSPFKHLKIIIKKIFCDIFYMSYIIMI
jgi:hypothetical protein